MERLHVTLRVQQRLESFSLDHASFVSALDAPRIQLPNRFVT